MLFASLAIKVEKKEGEQINYNKMKVKQLKTLLGKLLFLNIWVLTIIISIIIIADQRGVKCVGCSEKADFVKKCQETEHLEL